MVWMALGVALIVGTVQGSPDTTAVSDSSPDDLLMIKVDGDSVDFRLVDPRGRVAIIAVDSTMCAIADCSVSKSSDNPFHDDSEFEVDSAETTYEAYGGGLFVLENPPPGEWRLEALAARGCEERSNG